MQTKNKTFRYQTKECLDFIDITDEIKDFVKESNIKNGLVNIQTMHTTAMLTLNENEPLLMQDMKKHLSEVSPQSLTYNHDNFEIRTVNMCEGECANGHSHCKALHLLANITLNLIDGKLQVGMWQRVLFIELDRERGRKIQVQIIGE